MKVNWRDLVERVGWTALQAAAGVVLDKLVSGEVSWRAILYAACIAVLKVVVAQQVGTRGSGDAFPGGTAPGQ